MHLKKWIAGVLAIVCLFAFTACSSGGGDTGTTPPASGATAGNSTANGAGGTADQADTLVIYDGQFSEMQLLHRMVKLLVEEHTNATVAIKDEMSPVNAYNEVVRGSADLTNSYDGTLLTTFLHLDPADVPDDMTLYDFANEQGLEKNNVRLLDKLGLNNTYAIGVTKAVADEYSLKTISDLAAVADQLVFAAEHDFFTEEGSAKFNPMAEFYGLNFAEAKQIDISLKYSAVQNGDVDVTMVYATDGLNKEAGLVILEDDKQFFPEYNGALLIRDDLFDRFSDAAPNLEEVLNKLGGLFTDEIMVDLTYRCDVEMENIDDVAKDFLVQEGLIEG